MKSPKKSSIICQKLKNNPMNITRLNTLNDDKVIIKKEVGGNNDGGSSDNTSANFIQYFKVPKGWSMATYARMFGVILKADNVILPVSMVNNSIDSSITAYGIMPNLPINYPDRTDAKTLREYLETIGQSMLFTQTEITEEEFYSV